MCFINSTIHKQNTKIHSKAFNHNRIDVKCKEKTYDNSTSISSEKQSACSAIPYSIAQSPSSGHDGDFPSEGAAWGTTRGGIGVHFDEVY